MPNPNLPVVNAGIKYVNGYCLQKLTSTTMFLTTGEARDNRDENDIVIGDFLSPVNNGITLSTAYVGINGLDAGAVAASTYYFVYVVGDSSKNVASGAVFSTNNIVPALPYGCDIFRRVGVMKTDGSSNILTWYQYGRGLDRTYYYDAPVSILSGGGSTTFANVTVSPTGAPPLFQPIPAIGAFTNEVFLSVSYIPSSTTTIAEFLPGGSTATTGIVVFGAGTQKGIITVPAVAGVIRYKVQAGESLSLSVIGFKDYLGTPQ